MPLRDKLESEIREAMRSHDQARLDALRFLKNGIQQEEISSLTTLDDSGVVQVVAKQIKDRRESIEMFNQGHRPDLVAREQAAVAVLTEYLPLQLGHEELVQLIQQVIAEVGATSIRHKGRVMGHLMPQVRGKAEGGLVNQLVTELLTKA